MNAFLTSELGAWWAVAGVALALASTVLRERVGAVPGGERSGTRRAARGVHAALAVVVVILLVSTAARFATVA